MAQADAKILVLGVGNPLMGDEGVGPRTIEHLLSEYSFPTGVEVIDAGTMGFTMLNVFEGVDYAVIVDAVQGTGHEPGTVVLLDPDSLAPNQIMHSLHDARLPDVLDAARLMGMEPEVQCVAVQVGEIAHWELELSPGVEAAIPRTAAEVIALLAARDIHVIPRSGAARDETAALEQSNGLVAATGANEPARSARILRSLRTKDDIEG